MIRILQVVNSADRGGSETLAMNIYRNIDRTKIQFDFTNHNGVPAAYDSEIQSLGGKILYLPKFKGYNYFTYIHAWEKLFEKHPEYQIIHIHNYNISGIITKIARKQGVKIRITHSHSTRLNMCNIKKIIFNMFHESMMRNTTHFFSCGKNAGKFLFGPKQEFTIIPNAIDTACFKFNPQKRVELRNKLGIDDKTKLYGHVGSFRTPKNHTFLIDIFKEIVNNEASSLLVLVGSGDLLSKIKEKVDQMGLIDNVIFVGQQPNVNEWLSAFDVFIMPSLWEGFPVSAVEAQCAGLPCVISDVVDHNSDISGNVIFIPLTDSPIEWAKKIQKLTCPDRFKMGEMIEESDYNISRLSDKLTKFYQDCINPIK